MGKDYLVKGAKLMCVNGKGIVELDIPKEHGYDEKGRAKANCMDCEAETNIPYFEACKKMRKPIYVKAIWSWRTSGKT